MISLVALLCRENYRSFLFVRDVSSVFLSTEIVLLWRPGRRLGRGLACFFPRKAFTTDGRWLISSCSAGCYSRVVLYPCVSMRLLSWKSRSLSPYSAWNLSLWLCTCALMILIGCCINSCASVYACFKMLCTLLPYQLVAPTGCGCDIVC